MGFGSRAMPIESFDLISRSLHRSPEVLLGQLCGIILHVGDLLSQVDPGTADTVKPKKLK
ncbi:MAG: hypothetical protein STSR0001_02420 [Methanothrix sp.]